MHPEALSTKYKEIFAKLNNFGDFYLAGGTALALQIGHRISIDFDFFSEKEIPKNLLDKVKKIFFDKKVVISVNNPDELTVFTDEVKISFIKYPFPVLFDFIEHEGVKLLNVKEIAATKAYAIGRRGTHKDYVDLYFIISEKKSFLNEIIEISDKKYGPEFNSRLFLEQLTYLEDVDDTEILFLKEKMDRDDLKNFFENEIKKIKL